MAQPLTRSSSGHFSSSDLLPNRTPHSCSNGTVTPLETENSSWEVPLANIHATLDIMIEKVEALTAENAGLKEKVDLLFRENETLRSERVQRKAEPDEEQIAKLKQTCEFLSEKCEYLEKKLERTLEEFKGSQENFSRELSTLKKSHESHHHAYTYCPPPSQYNPFPRSREDKTGKPILY